MTELDPTEEVLFASPSGTRYHLPDDDGMDTQCHLDGNWMKKEVQHLPWRLSPCKACFGGFRRGREATGETPFHAKVRDSEPEDYGLGAFPE